MQAIQHPLHPRELELAVARLPAAPRRFADADDAETRRRVEAERMCVAVVGGGCLAPVAAHHDGHALEALVADEDGRWIERRRGDDPAALGAELAALVTGRA